MLRKLILTAISALSVFFISAQVTTSGISGIIKNSKNETLAGASVQAIHVPSGTVYNTVALSD
ncbi:MAG TPA: hypothetical protein VGM24_05240, partial [Puia sp.]